MYQAGEFGGSGCPYSLIIHSLPIFYEILDQLLHILLSGMVG